MEMVLKKKRVRKPYKKIEKDNGTIDIYGNHHWIELRYQQPPWDEDSIEECFTYKGVTYFLSEIMAVHNPVHNPNPPTWMQEFDGYMSDSFFSGILIKLGTGENEGYVKAYTFIS
jgi:hypothetical protein